MSGYYNPAQNPNIYNQGYATQVPIYPLNSPGPGHAPQPPPHNNSHPGYFGNGAYGSPNPSAVPYPAYTQPPFMPNGGPPSPMSPSSDSQLNKRPLPTPRARPTSVVYPPQAAPVPTSMPVHQRSMTFDPAAYNTSVFGQNQGFLPQAVVSNVVPGARPASVAFPPGWNPYPASPMGAPTHVNPRPLTSHSSRIKKDADLPPLPPNAGPGANSPTSGTPAAPGGVPIPGKRALPSAPGGVGTPGPAPAWNPQPGGTNAFPMASSPPDKRPLPSPSQSLPRISTIANLINAGQPGMNTVSPPAQVSPPPQTPPSTSSPTKRSLPSAPGTGGIKPGTVLPTSPPSSFVPTSSFAIPNASAQQPARQSPQPQPPARQETPPTSAPSSYASARSAFSNAPSVRPSSYSSPSPPPTGAPRSATSDAGMGSGGEDKRPLWKRMATASGQAVSSRPQSVFGHRRGVGSVGGEERSSTVPPGSSANSAARASAEPVPNVPERRQTVPAPSPTPAKVQSPALAPIQAPVKVSPPIPAPSQAPAPTPAARHGPLPTPPTVGRSRETPATKQVQPPQSQEQPPPTISKLPAGVQPTPIVPYQPKSRRTIPEPPKVVEQQPVISRPIENRPGGATPPNAPVIVPVGPSGKVRFSKESTVSEIPPRAVNATPITPASPPRPSAMKGGSAKSPPRASAMKSEGHTRAASGPASHSQAYGANGSLPRSQRQQPMYQIPLARPAPEAAPAPAPAAAPQVSMALRFASMDLQDEARVTGRDAAKWALVSSHDVATKPVPLTGYPDTPKPTPTAHEDERARRRRRSASTGTIAASLEDPPPQPAIAARRGSFDGASPPDIVMSSEMNTAKLIQAASASGGMRRGGARPMPSRGPSSRAQSRSPSAEEYPQYKPSYTDSEDEDGGAGPKITISAAAPQISVSAPQINVTAPEVPSIHIESDDVPVISITVDEPPAPMSAASIPVFAFNEPDEEQPEEAAASGDEKGSRKKKKKHRRQKSVKEEEDERERARQRAKTQPLPPKIKKNSARCGKCDKPILGRIVSAMNARWHPECFRCSVCETFLEHVSSYEHDDRPYCHLDYHELFAPRCFHCKTPIMEEHFITLDDDALGKRTYHEQHFFCAECGDPFLAPKQERKTRQLENGMLEVLDQEDEVGFTVYKGHPYCEACHVRLRMPRCKRCKKSIRPGDQAIEALGGKWCWECFTCNRCSKPFEDPQFYEYEQKPFCQPCYSILLVNQLG